MARREEVREAPRTYEEAYAELAAEMRALHIARVSEMPRIELYLDQVLSIVTSELAFMSPQGERILTGAMVNNYVKQRIVPAPTKKRYTRRHLASLLFVCSFKRVLSIAQIGQVFALGSQAGVDIERAYDDMLTLFEVTLAALFPANAVEPARECPGELCLYDLSGNRVASQLERLLEKAVVMLAYTVYVDRMLALQVEVATGED